MRNYKYEPGPIMKQILAAEGKKIPVKDRKWRDPEWHPTGPRAAKSPAPVRDIPTTWADTRERILSRLEDRKPRPQLKPSKWPKGTDRIKDQEANVRSRARRTSEAVELLTEADEAYNQWLEEQEQTWH